MVRFDFEVIEDVENSDRFNVQVVGYWHDVRDQEGHELIAYHWHPTGASTVRTPHLHLSSRINPVPVASGTALPFAGMHIPTGFVTLQNLVRFLIIEFGVVPRRSDWEAVLATTF